MSSSSATGAGSPVLGLPRVPRSVLPRPRISTAIADSLAANDLVVVRSPAGTGKTVALADWAASGFTPGHISWITVDAGYSGRTSFWHEMMIGAERQADPSLRPFIKECGDALLAGVDPRAVLRRIVPHVPVTTLVIDRVDAIQDDELFDDMIWALRNSRNIKVVSAARTRTPFDAPSLSLALDVAHLGPELFHLTLEETTRLLDSRGSSIGAAELHAATGGHPLLTRATLAVHGRDSRHDVATSARTAVSDFLDLSLSGDGLDDDAQDFMVRTSIPESFTGDLARQLCGTDNVEDLLDRLEDKGLGMRFKYRDQVRFRYAAAVRATLTGSLCKLDPREIDRITRIVIDHELAASNIVSAFRLAFRAGHLDLASTIACEHHLALLPSQIDAVRKILESVPLTRIRRYPALIMALALCCYATPGDEQRALELFDLAAVFARASRPALDPAQRIWTVTIESAALRFAGKLEPALKQAQAAVQGFEESPLELRERLAALEPTLYIQAAIGFIHDQQFGRAAQLLARGVSAAHRTGSVPSVFLATGLLAFALAQDGRVRESRTHLTWLDEARWPPGMADGYWATGYRLAQLREAMDLQDYRAAAGLLAHIGEEMRDSEFWPHILYFETHLALLLGSHGPGPATLEAAIRRYGKHPVNPAGAIELDALRASVFLIAGQPAKAATVMEKYPFSETRVRLTRARIALSQGNPSRTLALTRYRLEQLGPRQEVSRLLLRAAAFRRLGDEQAAVDNARAAGVLMDEYGLAMSGSLVPEEDLPQLAADVQRFVPSIPDPVPTIPPAPGTQVSLTPREKVVLQALADHGTATEVAARLNVSLNTVKSQSRSINKKLGTSSKDEAILKAQRLGLLDD